MYIIVKINSGTSKENISFLIIFFSYLKKMKKSNGIYKKRKIKYSILIIEVRKTTKASFRNSFRKSSNAVSGKIKLDSIDKWPKAADRLNGESEKRRPINMETSTLFVINLARKYIERKFKVKIRNIIKLKEII